jgi:cAMP-dependent protein kinase regulator
MSDSHVADVQAELQQYLNSKNINGLFIQIVESLLIEKPANPVAFMIEYLYKQFPDQAKAAGIGAPTAESKSEPETKDSGHKDEKGRGDKKADPVYSDSEEEDEDEMGEMEEFVPRAKPVGRRVSVSAESMDPNKLKEQQSQLVVIEKSPEVVATLLEVVSKSPLLRTLDEEQRDQMVKAFSGPLIKEDGEDIIVEGDIGDVFYLIEEGSVDVYVSKVPDTVVHTYGAGDSFGELAIMYNAPRAATCRSKGISKLWALDRVSFKVIVVAAAMQKREKFVGFLKQVPILESLTEMELMTMADSMAEEKYSDGDVICRQGDSGDYFYIVHDGAAICKQKDAEGEDKVVAELESGNYFGEIALLTEKPRQATVVASGNLKVLSLDKATFTRVMGPLDDIMKRNMSTYNKHVE